MDYLYLAGWLLAGALMLAGLAGNLLPLVPAAPLLFSGLLMAAWLDDFQRVGWGWLALLLVLAILLAVVDLLAGAWGAKRAGASRLALIGATLGAVLGLLFGLPGLVLGPFVGAALGEWLASGEAVRAGRVGLASWLGLLLGTVIKLGLSLLMLALFAFAWWV